MTSALDFSTLGSGRAISEQSYKLIQRTIKSTCGIDLGDEKQSFVVSRLGPLVEREGYASIEEFCTELQGPKGRQLLSELVDCISTNHTFFNRENRHFAHFCEVSLPDSIRFNQSRGLKRLRIWCAASSYGQEPYTLAMLMMNHLGLEYSKWDAGVLATDISNKVLAHANEGRYPSADLAPLPKSLVHTYFVDQGDGFHVAKPELKQEVLFRRFNLMNTSLPFKSSFDIVFCRNVMIYFDEDTKRGLVARIKNQLRRGGFLYVGAAENLPPNHGMIQVAPSVFRRA